MSTPPPKDNRDLLKRALLKIDNLQAQLDQQHEPIAVVGISLRFPNGANDPQKFWQLLRNGVDGITEIPASRWNVDDYYDPDPEAPGKMYTRCAGFIDNVDRFDPQFFGIAPREAQSMDPQQRLLLEVTWEALERAGQAPCKLVGSRTGVYIGISGNDYSHLQAQSAGAEAIDTYFGAGVAHSIASGRISYVLGLQGPSVSVDTACSASLTAVHLACQSLRSGETEMALAGGVNVILSPDGIITASQARMLSPEGRCKTFDASANGYVRSEGCALVVLKRLSDARANNDNILALIRGTAANQDGRSGGLTAPNGEAQQAVIRAALANANLKPKDISYLETHGTGTALGDPIEVQALGAVFGASHSKERPLLLGAVKSNIGHLEAAAGIAGLIKTVLALQHGELPPSLHVKQLNPHIAWEKLPVQVITKLTPWVAHEGKRLAGVSSFGFSGTNVHVVVEEFSDQSSVNSHQLPTSSAKPTHVLALSAKNDAALRELAQSYEQHLATNTEHALAEVAFTANAGRAHFNHRLALIAETSEQARAQLAAFVVDEKPAGVLSGKIDEGHRAEVAFLFTGQGAQYLDMGKQLYETQPVFRAALDKCDELLRPHLDVPLFEVLFDSPLEGGQGVVGDDVKNLNAVADASNTPLTPLQGGITSSIEHRASSIQLDQTRYTQPALFALEYALAELWRSWGVVPSAVMGHSVGEYVAACVAGVFSLEDGLKLIAARARLMQALPQNGSMAAVFANEETVRKAIMSYLDQVDIAAINGSKNIVISGEREALNEILRKLQSEGIQHKPLAVSHAFHSPLLEPMLDEFERIASEVHYAAPRIPLVSNVTGQFVADDEITSALYWRKHVREAVRFAEAMETLHEHGCKIFVELGPTPTLLSMGQRCLPEAAQSAWLPSLRKGRGDEQQILESLASLYVHGVNVDWARFYQHDARRRVVLPTYPFQRQRYWAKVAELRSKIEDRGSMIENRRSKITNSRSSILDSQSSTLHPLLGERLRSALKEIQFEARIDVHAQPFLREHQFYGTPVFPATAYVETALAAAQAILGEGAHSIEQLTIHEALLLPEEETRSVQFIFTPQSEHAGAFQIFSARMEDEHKQEQWILHASGTLHAHAETEVASADLQTLQQRCARALDVKAYYEKFRSVGVDYGPSFQGLARLWQGENEALAEIRLDEESENPFHFHPGLLDACFQLFGVTFFDEEETGHEAKVYMPAGCERLTIYREGARAFWCHVQLHEGHHKNSETLRGDLFLFDEKSGPIAKIESLCFKRARRTALQKTQQNALAEWLYEVQWEQQTLAEAARAVALSANDAWTIFADEQGFAASLTEQLQAQNIPVVLVRKGASFARINKHEWHLNPQQREEFARFFAEAFSRRSAGAHIVYGWSLDAEIADSASAEEVLAAERLICEGALHLVQTLAQSGALHPPRLWLLTRGAHPVGDEIASSKHAQYNSPLEGGVAGGAQNSENKNTPLNPPSRGESQYSPLEGGQGGVARETSDLKKENTALKGEIKEVRATLQPTQTSLWGLANVIALEHPALQCSCIDLEANAHSHQAPRVIEEILAHTREPRIAFRNNERFVARVIPVSSTTIEHRASSIEHPASSIKLEIRERGVLENLKLVAQTRRAPERGEVEVRVLATGLNFRDVLNALGMYPGDPGPLGNECVGTIATLGEGVSNLKIGAQVMVLAADSFASYVTTDARFVLPMPKALSMEEAATLPITFLTAHYALHHLAQMKAGERVLIHAAAGGVGLAAIQLAQRAGAEIFATASSAEKHEHLRGLGVKNIFSSRTLDFAEEIMRATNGEGVDLVLNSLAGEFIPKSLSLLRTGGRFLEIGKTDVWNEARVKALMPEVAYHVIYLGEIIHEQPKLMRALFEELTRAFETGELRPLPFKSFPLEDAVHAFRYMAQAKHIGKVVLVQSVGSEDRGLMLEDGESNTTARSSILHPPASIFHPQSTILITGGFGALGLHVAKWLVESGARHIVLVGRKAPSANAQAAIAEMEKFGARIVVAPIDISQEEEVRKLLDDITRTLPPLRGVIHSAGVLDDGVLMQQDWARFTKVMAPKVLGAWHLHRLTKELPLDFFVLFSSIAAMFGAPSQGNYAAANAFMDGLAHYRRKQGLPALSINWGPWAEGGMVTDLGNRGEARLIEQGLSLIKPEPGLQALTRLLRGAHTQAAVLPVNWMKFSRQFKRGEEPAFFAHVLKAGKPKHAKPQAQTPARDFVRELETALPAERLALLTAHVREQVVKVLGLDAAQTPEPRQGLTDLGMDSLMAVELSNRLRASLGRTLPSTIAFEYPTIAALTNFITTEVLRWDTFEEANAKQVAKQNGKADLQQEIEQIAEGELEDSLLKELEEAGY